MTVLKISLLTLTLLLASFATVETEQNAQKASSQRDAGSLDPSPDEDNGVCGDDCDDENGSLNDDDDDFDDDDDDYDDDVDDDDDYHRHQQQQHYHHQYYHEYDYELHERLRTVQQTLEKVRQIEEEMKTLRSAIACKVEPECFQIDGWTYTGMIGDRVVCCPVMDGQGIIFRLEEGGTSCSCKKAPPPATRCKVDSECADLVWGHLVRLEGHIVCCPNVLGQSVYVDKNGICGCLKGPEVVATSPR